MHSFGSTINNRMTEIDYSNLLLGYLTFHVFASVMACVYWAMFFREDGTTLGGTVRELNILTFVGVSLFYPWGLLTFALYVAWNCFRLARWRDVTAREIADVIVKKIELEETEKKRAQQLKVERRAQEERARAAAARIKREHIRAEKQKLFEAQQRLEYWDELDGHVFEREFADLLRRNGWVANETRKSGDAGIDIEAKDPEGFSVVIECKRWKQGSKVGREVVQKLYGAALSRYDRLVVITTAGFTAEAKAYAREASIELWGRDRLLKLIDSAGKRD